jgi:hypothetical protein
MMMQQQQQQEQEVVDGLPLPEGAHSTATPHKKGADPPHNNTNTHT